MKVKTLLILAAGLGTRYGGLKQLDTFGPDRELLMDYSIFDAIEAGFNKIVFVVRESFIDQFKKLMIPKLDGIVSLEFVCQENDDLPNSIKETTRKKPWGTAHAVWAARHVIHEPFLVINADDYYGKNAYLVAYKFLKRKSKDFAVIGYRLGDTLSDFSTVNRGICFRKIGSEKLDKIIEFKGIKMDSNSTLSFTKPDGYYKQLIVNEVVSMNMFCLSPVFFEYTEIILEQFLNEHQHELDKELLISNVIDQIIRKRKIKTFILDSNSDWFGVTYKADRIMARYKIEDKIKYNQYPKSLFQSRQLQ
jgi:NDP-sugar pyrophosphorylase family protein